MTMTRPTRLPMQSTMHVPSRRRAAAVLVVVMAAAFVAVGAPRDARAVPGGTQVPLAPWISPPPSLSSSGDFATDVFGDPWDFSNPEDLIAVDEVGTQSTSGVSIGGGVLDVTTRVGSTIRLLFDWPGVLPWGRDGWNHPIDAARYTQVTFRICVAAPIAMLVRFENAFGREGYLRVNPPAGCSVQHADLAYQGPVYDNGQVLYAEQYPGQGPTSPWQGPIVRFELHRGGAGGNVQVQLDWVRLHRADAPQQPVSGTPRPVVHSPDVEGGADYATVERGNPWDFEGPDDVALTHQIVNGRIESGLFAGTSTSNDPFLALPLGPDLNTDRYRRLTLDACYDGPFGLADAPGGGMVGRMAWMPRGTGTWTETQDFVVFPGCHRMTIDLATADPGALNDEASGLITGWRGVRPDALRFDFHEDRGWRNVALREVRLADDDAFSTTFPITFSDAAAVPGTVADIWVTTRRGSFDGVRIAADRPVASGVNTFVWNGTDASGRAMPNATYWVYVTMRAGQQRGVGVSSGPVRIERPVPTTPSWFVPLTPARLLDTRTGTGGNIWPLATGAFTELDVTGVGGVPDDGVTAVVLNVTVDAPDRPGFLTAWPSGEPRPTVANLNFVPGQTVPNLVTVKVGANGRVNLFNSQGNTAVVADVAGYYTSVAPTNGGRFTPLTPARVLDTRDGTGRSGVVGPVGGDRSIDLRVTGVGGVPSTGVTAVALNVTVDQPTGSGFITTWPTGEQRPFAATHTFAPGLTVGNLVLAKVGANGNVSLYNSNGSTHLVADVVGYFSSSGGRFVPLSPTRLVDTRNGLGGRLGVLGGGSTFTVDLTDGVVPDGATGVVVNVTAADSDANSYLTVWPTGVAMPTAATLNPRPGVPVPNQAYLKLGPGGRLDVFNFAGTTHVVIDVFGYVI
jgi:hypothetical protein